jgi:hypothetical protein
MKAIFRSLACVVFGASLAFAESPKPTQIVVLDNENLLEGEVSRVDEGYEIRRQVGGDVTLPRNRVLAVVADRKAAFQIVFERANRRDADERLRLARWCSANGLPAEALSEARTAARMRSGFAAAERYVASLEAAMLTQVVKPDVVPASAQSPKPDTVTEIGAIDYNSESFPLFASRVNAVLVNACASCHARDDAKSFRLTRMGGRAGVTKNLMAALPHINAKDPASSAILTKAITAHGTGKESPFKTKQHPAYQNLETWAHSARAAEGTPPPVEPKKLPDLDVPVGPLKTGEKFGQDSPSQSGKPTTTVGADPFDPAIFNRDGKKK